MYRAVFRIDHHSVYANATAEGDLAIDMWCGRHADLLLLQGDAVEDGVDAIREVTGIADRIDQNGEVVVVTDRCLLSHQDNLLEGHLRRHDCLTFYPVTYSDGQVLTRVISLEQENLSEFYRSLEQDFPIEVESIQELDSFDQHQGIVFDADLPAFSDRQREALSTAFVMGYYQIPRNATTEEIAAELGINRRTFEEHLRRAEMKAIQSLMDMNKV